MNHNEIVIVGAGPVGLWTAIQIKQRSPEAQIHMYEKHHEYQRSHVLRLDYWSLILYAKQSKSAREKAFYEQITGEDFSAIGKKFTQSIYIRTNELEAALKSFAMDLGVHIHYEFIQSPVQVELLHPQCDMFIAADGAKSVLRQALLGENGLEEIPLQHIVEIKYQSLGKGKKFVLQEQFKHNTELEHMVFEYVGKSQNNVCPVTLRFFLDKEVYEQIPVATFKNPLSLENSILPESLKQDIDFYLQARAKYGEAYVEQSSKISKLVLAMYASEKFAIEHNQKAWFLTGDAAMGVPYFRALNSGLILSSRLGQIISGKLLANSLKQKMFLYNTHRPMHIATEFSIARSKDLGLQSYDFIRKLNLKDMLWEFTDNNHNVKSGKKRKL